MTTGIFSGVQSMATNQKQMDSHAHNLANTSTTGFKRKTSFVHALATQSLGGDDRELRVKSKIDFSQGELEPTGNPLDLALDGRGFFAVEGPEGEIYTRNGHFQVDKDGVLKTLEGLPLAWENLGGAIDNRGLPIVVNGEGVVRQGERELGRLRIVDFADEQELELHAGGYFAAPLDLKEAAHSAHVVQGALEKSNVNPIEEMVAMISVQRRFAGASNVLGMINETYRRLSRMQ